MCDSYPTILEIYNDTVLLQVLSFRKKSTLNCFSYGNSILSTIEVIFLKF